MKDSFDVQKIRAQFPILQCKMNGFPLIYFDSAATAQKPEAMIERTREFMSKEYATVHRSIYALSMKATEKYDTVRDQLKKYFHADSYEAIFTRGTTESLNLISTILSKGYLKKGDEILLTPLEHHSNLVPWQMIQEEIGVKIRYIPVDEKGNVILEGYKALFNEKTKVLSIAEIANSVGTVHLLDVMIPYAHAKGVLVVVDGAQGAPSRKVQLDKLEPDFYVFSGHKFYGPTGIGILFGKKELLDALPPYQGGGDMIERVTLEKTTYTTPPLKFEAGTPSIVEVIGLGQSLSFVESVGIENIEAHEKKLTSYLLQGLKEIPRVRLIGEPKERGAIVSFILDGAHPLDVGTLLDAKGVAIRTGHHCADPAMKHFGVSATCRVSFGMYNTLEEIDLFLKYLEEISRIL